MKKYGMFLCMLPLLCSVGCGEDVEKSASAYISKAQQSLDSKQYALAKLQLDSVKQCYPKAFEARKVALRMQLEVDKAEQLQSKTYADSLLQQALRQKEEMLPTFYLDKDARYQDVGYYYLKNYKVDNRRKQNYIRAQVDENGKFSLVAFYHGRTLQLKSLRFSVADGTFVTTPDGSENLLQTSDVSGRSERNDWVLDPNSDVVNFVRRNADEAIKAEFIGAKSKVKVSFTKNDSKALLQVADLAKVLQSIESGQKMLAEINRRITFLDNRLEKDSSTVQP